MKTRRQRRAALARMRRWQAVAREVAGGWAQDSRGNLITPAGVVKFGWVDSAIRSRVYGTGRKMAWQMAAAKSMTWE